MDIFTVLGALTKDKIQLDFNNDEVKSIYNKYMINRFVSMVDVFVPLVNEINKYDVPDYVHFNYYFNALPKRKIYFNYIKKSKDVDSVEKKCIAKYFDISLNDVDEYIKCLSEEEINDIVKIYKHIKDAEL